MTKYRENLRLQSLRFSERNIARSCSVSRNAVSKVLKHINEIYGHDVFCQNSNKKSYYCDNYAN